MHSAQKPKSMWPPLRSSIGVIVVYGREGLLAIIHLKILTQVFLMEPTRRKGLFCSTKPTVRSQVFCLSEQYFPGIFVSMTFAHTVNLSMSSLSPVNASCFSFICMSKFCHFYEKEF